jgi:tRNA (adenine37-N6)-methyltransferase
MYTSSDHRIWSPLSTIVWLTIAISVTTAAASIVTTSWNEDNHMKKKKKKTTTASNKSKDSTEKEVEMDIIDENHKSLWSFHWWKEEFFSRMETSSIFSGLWCLLPPSSSFNPFTSSSLSSTKAFTQSNKRNDLTMNPIGTVYSIYRLCVGTPRQGMLAPNARGRIELTVDNAMDMVQGLEGFSHIWIIFVFHLNTTPSSKISTSHKGSNNKTNKSKETSPKKNYPTKISPPALGGTEKVGIFSTRTPHRVNPIGMTLCKLDSIVTKHTSQNQKRNRSSVVILNVSGLDLVDGTPVLDIKPYVPHYDSVPVSPSATTNLSSLPLSATTSTPCSIPDWVSQGLSAQRTVHITENARQHLISILQQNPYALEHFGPHRGDDCILTTVAAVWKCIDQVLSMDVRSEWQTRKVRVGASHAELSQRIQEYYGLGGHVVTTAAANSTPLPPLCSQQIDNLLIYFTVAQPQSLNRVASKGSGAEDQVTVHAVEPMVRPNPSTTSNQSFPSSPPSTQQLKSNAIPMNANLMSAASSVVTATTATTRHSSHSQSPSKVTTSPMLRTYQSQQGNTPKATETLQQQPTMNRIHTNQSQGSNANNRINTTSNNSQNLTPKGNTFIASPTEATSLNNSPAASKSPSKTKGNSQDLNFESEDVVIVVGHP